MAILTVRHLTTYTYRQPVAFGEHRMMLRPREGHDQRLIEARIDITPEPAEIRWVHDVFGNSLTVVRFTRRARELRVESTSTLDHSAHNVPSFQLDPHASAYPIAYAQEEMPDLARSIERHYPDPERRVDTWARTFLPRRRPHRQPSTCSPPSPAASSATSPTWPGTNTASRTPRAP